MKKTKSILFAQNNNKDLSALYGHLTKHFNYPVIYCSEWKQAWSNFKRTNCLLCLMDTNVFSADPADFVKMIRRRNDLVPIVLISSNASLNIRIRSLRHGADGFLQKPISPLLLELYLKAILRRTQIRQGKADFRILENTFSLSDRKFRDKDNKVLLTMPPRIAELYAFFLNHSGKTILRKEILYRLWTKDDPFNGRSMDVCVSQLRNILYSVNGGTLETIHGIGFKFVEPRNFCDNAVALTTI